MVINVVNISFGRVMARGVFQGTHSNSHRKYSHKRK